MAGFIRIIQRFLWLSWKSVYPKRILPENRLQSPEKAENSVLKSTNRCGLSFVCSVVVGRSSGVSNQAGVTVELET